LEEDGNQRHRLRSMTAIESFRPNTHYVGVVEAHFTMVFEAEGLDEDYYALISKMRLDLGYIPHITIGRCSDRHHAKALCDSLNMRGVSIAGRIDELTVAAVDRDKVEKLRSFKLGAGS
jgi:hypothetical protein